MQLKKEKVGEQLAKILSSDGFKSAHQLQRFLTYVVECSIQGREDRLSAYFVATNALGRGKGFTPDDDPIVRVLASRLRRRLDHYNQSVGIDDTIHISLPKGGYTPLIEENMRGDTLGDKFSSASQSDGMSTKITPIVLVELFESDASQFCKEFAQDLFYELVSSLNKFTLVRVLPQNKKTTLSSLSPKDEHNTSSVYRLNGNCRTVEGIAHVRVFLTEDPSGISIWSQTYQIDATQSNNPTTCLPLVAEIAPTLAKVSGVIFTDLLGKNSASGLSQDNAIGLIVASYGFTNQPEEAGFIVARAAVQRAVEIAPHSSYAWSRFSTILLDGYYFGFGGLAQSNSLLDLAYKYALKAKELAPLSCTSNLVYSNALFGLGHFDEAVKAGEYAITMNPLNIDLAAEHGHRRAMKGGWVEGLQFIEAARKNNRIIPARWVFTELCFHYLNGRFEIAMEISRSVDFPDFYIYQAILTCLYNKIGNKAKAQNAMANLQKLKPNLKLDDLQIILGRYTTDIMANKIIKSLRKNFEIN